MDIDYFDIISNEVVDNIVYWLDLVSLYRFTSTCKRLIAFKQISNEQWRRYYAQKWYLEDKELEIYPIDNWQQLYHARLKAENEYLLRLTLPLSPTSEVLAITDEHGEKKNCYYVQPKEGSEEVDTFYAADIDPWGFILRYSSDDQEKIRASSLLISGFWDDPFTKSDVKREIVSGRFDILVSCLSKYASQNIDVLENLLVFEDFYDAASDAYKEQRKRPFGLLGLLAKYLDVTLPLYVLGVVANTLWDVAAAGDITEDLFVGLDLIPKLINILLKCTDTSVVTACLSILTWFKPSKPENTKILNNAPFMNKLVELLAEERSEIFDTLPRLLVIYGQFNLSVIIELSVVSRLVELMRKHGHGPLRLKLLLAVCHALCIYSKDCCAELAQHETALEFIMSLVNNKEESNRDIAENALNVIDTVARTEIGAERLLELNTIDRLLPHMEDPTNTHLFRNLFCIIHSLSDYANMNGFGDEIFAKLLQHKDALIDRGDDSATPEVREACNAFWMNFSCAIPPPRDVSIKLIARTLPIIPTESRLNVKKDAALLLANIAEVDFEAFEGKDLTSLFQYLAEYLINFDAAKEQAELLRLEKIQENELQLKAGGVAGAEVTEPSEEKVDVEQGENRSEGDVDVEGKNEEDSMLVDESHDEDVMEHDHEMIDQEPHDGAKVTLSPWPLNLLAYLVRSDNLKQLAIQNEKLMNKLFALYDDKSLIYEGQYMVMYFFSHLVRLPGWASVKALDYIEDFAMKAPHDIEWNFVFSLIEPYAHLLKKDNPTPLVIFGSWFLAHMSTTEPGRQILKKDLDPEVIKWMKVYPHSRVEHNITQFSRNMKKKIRI